MPGEGEGDTPGDSPGIWLTITEAARRLGVTPKAIRNRIHHSTIEWRAAGNRGREVLVTPAMEAEGDPGDSPGTVTLLVQVARLEERLTASERREMDLAASLQRERERTDHLAVELAEARRGWLERLLEALRGRPPRA
jgi:hypothetical protein